MGGQIRPYRHTPQMHAPSWYFPVVAIRRRLGSSFCSLGFGYCTLGGLAIDCGVVNCRVVDRGVIDCGIVDCGIVDCGIVDCGTLTRLTLTIRILHIENRGWECAENAGNAVLVSVHNAHLNDLTRHLLLVQHTEHLHTGRNAARYVLAVREIDGNVSADVP